MVQGLYKTVHTERLVPLGLTFDDNGTVEVPVSEYDRCRQWISVTMLITSMLLSESPATAWAVPVMHRY